MPLRPLVDVSWHVLQCLVLGKVPRYRRVRAFRRYREVDLTVVLTVDLGCTVVQVGEQGMPRAPRSFYDGCAIDVVNEL